MIIFVLLLIPSCIAFDNNEIPCDPQCSLSLVETIPVGLVYPNGAASHPETSQVWLDLINNAKNTIYLASFYWTLRGTDVMPDADNSSSNGEKILSALQAKAGLVEMRIAVSADAEDFDTASLKSAGAIVRNVNMTALVGAGVLHTKFLLIDGKDFYLGSANMDWRSLSQVKEMGILAQDCECLAQDLAKIFSVYWLMGNSSSVPETWPKDLETAFNITNPSIIQSQNLLYSSYLSSSPPAFSPRGRTDDVAAILYTIDTAKEFIHIAVMDYFPKFLYSREGEYWPVIDDALRRAYVTRKVSVKLLVSKWEHSRLELVKFAQSLNALDGIHQTARFEVRLFTVPSNASQSLIPFARVNHNKYMVTDVTALIGTSNWSADYFTDTAGVSLVLTPENNQEKNTRTQLNDVFMRDWISAYSHSLD